MTEFVVMGLLPDIAVIAAGWCFVAPAWVGVALAAGGLVLAVWSLSLDRVRVATAA